MQDLITLSVPDLGKAGNMKEYAGSVTLTGLIIVFAMLILLVLIITVFGLVMSSVSGNAKKNKESVPKKVVAKPVAKVDVNPTQIKTESNDDGVIAAISAAVMMMYEGTGKTPVIRSIKPVVTGGRSAWKQAGILNNTRSF